jgi:hypothetical protein
MTSSIKKGKINLDSNMMKGHLRVHSRNSYRKCNKISIKKRKISHSLNYSLLSLSKENLLFVSIHSDLTGKSVKNNDNTIGISCNF